VRRPCSCTRKASTAGSWNWSRLTPINVRTHSNDSIDWVECASGSLAYRELARQEGFVLLRAGCAGPASGDVRGRLAWTCRS
jgi:hypothetical protein